MVSSDLPDPVHSTGAQLGKYRIVRRIGEGAFGVVYEALLPGPMGFSKRVALKMVRRHVVEGDPRFVQSMVNEARIGGLLHHANIVDVFEFGEIDGRYYIAMEFVDGATLAEVIQLCRTNRVLLPRFAIIDLLLQVCRGLHHAHSFRDADGTPLNLIHRDLKPSNIVIDTSGTAKVLDFGIAKAASNLFNTTQTAMVKGTPRYMSPEQIEGKQALTPASDIFSLGVILYEAITGRVLFDADSLPGLVHAIMYEDRAPKIEQAEVAFPGSRALLERMLAREREERYPDAITLAADVRTLGQRYPAQAEMSEVIGRLLPRVDRTHVSEVINSDDLRLSATAPHTHSDGSLTPIDNPSTITPADPTSAGWDRFSRVFDSSEQVRQPGPTVIGPARHPAPGSDPGTSGGPAPTDDSGLELGRSGDEARRARTVGLVLGGVAVAAVIAALVWIVALGGSRRWQDGIAERGDEGAAAEADAHRAPGGVPGAPPPDGTASGAAEVGEDGAAEVGEDGAAESAAAGGGDPGDAPREAPGTGDDPGGDPRPPAAEARDEARDGETAEGTLEPVEAAPPVETRVAEASPPAAPPSAQPEPARLSLSSRPWSNLFIDGNPVRSQKNVFKDVEIAGGRHQVMLVCPTLSDRSKTWQIDIDGRDVQLGCWDFEQMQPCPR